ncbi:pyridoxamine 5'-phosphate oxidase family protein [Glacieibacterium frigidum]|uniref:Pyridoxamine 5'-phosphate oxidase n=1 Tax=Glacieibacterium frigidum TaxID=2593303 RepID=A0A552UIU6_9SPHN|nr:pyridoxamine 5'-phosphate oxidase family protein [Glacieibacterium frigidum]TRW18135.1 pyridoxamine 5'-phosphate oxidase [Glacieibacterium frigidum]
MPMTLPELAKAMRKIDFAMLQTHSEGGTIAGRPMSNNAEVEYDGDSWYFSYEDTRTCDDIKADPKVALAFQANTSLLGKPGLMVAVEGVAELIRDKAVFAEHWTSNIERWFPQGIDTPGLVLIKVEAVRIHYWAGEDEGEITL